MGLIKNNSYFHFQLILLFFIFNSLTTLALANGKAALISDSLVENLNCNQLNVNSIFEKIRPDAFNNKKHIPQKNWGFESDGIHLGACWSLSHAQRVFFYLAQWQNTNPPAKPILDSEKINILNFIRGSQPYMGSFSQIHEHSLKRFNTFTMNFNQDSSIFENLMEGVWDPLKESLLNITDIVIQSLSPMRFENGKLFRNFKSEIEVYQTDRFMRFGNSQMALEPVPRLGYFNIQTVRTLMDNADNKRLSLVNLKAALQIQHVILVKSYEKTHDNIYFKVYDSNYPSIDNILIYNFADAQFTAPQIIKKFNGISDPEQYVSIYLVDESGRDKIEEALLSHYKSQCRELTKQ